MPNIGSLTPFESASSSSGSVHFVTGNDGIAVGPDGAGTIFIIGNTGQSVATSGNEAVNTLTVTVADSTTANKGVVTLSTDAEAISGTSTSVVLTPSNLTAKLGIQTLYGLPIGGGSSSSLSWTSAPTNGQLLIGYADSAPVLATLTAGPGVSIVNGPGSITISAGNTSGMVSSIAGTANQIVVSSPINAVVLSLANGISLGSYQSTLPPTGGILASGAVGIGTSSPQNELDVAGSVAVGTYAGVNTAPTNGLIVSGNTSIGSSTATSQFNVGSANQFQVTSLGVASAPEFQLNGATSGVISILPQSAAGTYNFNLPITSGTAGYLLTSQGGGASAMTWSNPTSIAVTSLQGTANQVLVSGTSGSAQTGALSVAFPATGGISIGSYQSTTPPTGGIICPGVVGIGTSAPKNELDVNGAMAIGSYAGADVAPTNGLIVSGAVGIGASSATSTQLYVASSAALYTIQTAGTSGSTNASTGTYSISTNDTLVSGAAPNCGGIRIDSNFSVPVLTETVTNFSGVRATPNLVAGNGSITNAIGIFSDNEWGTAALTVTNAYGAFFNTPNITATHSIALYADNAAVGYTATTPPTSGLIVKGNVSFGSSSAPSLFNVGTSNQFQVNSSGIVTAGIWEGSVVGVSWGGTGLNGSTAPNGSLLIGNGTGYSLNTLSPGSNISITNGSGMITISADTASQVVNYTAVSAGTYTVAATDYYLSCDPSGGSVTLDFPNAPTSGRIWVVKDRTGWAATNHILVTTLGGTVTIDSLTTYTMSTDYQSIELIFNGTSYEVY